MGGVILGFPGPWAKDYCEVSDHYTSKIGGLPDWPIPRESIPSDLLQCGACGSNLCLVAQVYAPILSGTLKIEERIIYIFGCVMPKCGDSLLSWHAVRVQKSNNVEGSPTCKQVIPSTVPSGSISNSNKWWEEDSWTCRSGEEDEDNIDLEELGRALSEAACLASNSKKKKKSGIHKSARKCSPVLQEVGVVHANIPVVPCFYIYSQEQASSRDVSSVCLNYASLSIKENQSDFDSLKEEEVWGEESYEYDRALYADRTYLKFKKWIDAHPEQCYRYSYGGKPLLATKGLGEPGACALCGASRHYEMQLMPPLLFFLREARDGSATHSPDWNWMTLLVYTCSKNCSQWLNNEKSNNGGWTVVKEAIIIQNEEELHESTQVSYFS
ncbi:programmed cell death protein 2-like isoform X2 [Macadamia integrifolia]|uniref:programmed cell death protein 2-like isoform X2 n=1 Tax=Macadamia integrifolia TaxID=60698 RepID=UPI001C50247D|nr:programmed cell death protein 2-like isoform X2 [Macadamia integrifolia]